MFKLLIKPSGKKDWFHLQDSYERDLTYPTPMEAALDAKKLQDTHPNDIIRVVRELDFSNILTPMTSIQSVVVTGDPVVPQNLTAQVLDAAGQDITDNTIIQWQQADAIDGEWELIPYSIGKVFKLVTPLVDKHVRAIAVGDGIITVGFVASESIGPVTSPTI